MKQMRMITRVAIPLVFGSVGIFGVISYLCMIQEYKIPMMVDMCAIISAISFLLGIVSSIITRKYRKINNALWLSGTLICIMGVLIWIVLLGILIALSLALREL